VALWHFIQNTPLLCAPATLTANKLVLMPDADAEKRQFPIAFIRETWKPAASSVGIGNERSIL
jgi:hypothetical protein